MQYFRKIEVKTLLILLQLNCRNTFIEIYRFIVHNFSKKTIKFAFIILSNFFEKNTVYELTLQKLLKKRAATADNVNKSARATADPSIILMFFAAVPLMHVLAIHMKVMLAERSSMSELWGDLTGLWTSWDSLDTNGQLVVRPNSVPLMMQDPMALMTHFILLLPLNMDLSYFSTITRACFNLQLAQTLVRIAFTLSYSERSLLRAEFNKKAKKATFAALLGQVIENLETTGLFSKEEDVIEMVDSEAPPPSMLMLDINSLEMEAARLLVPFLRTASLIRHYVYKLDLPDILEDDEEFDQLIKFLDLKTKVFIKTPDDLEQDSTEEKPMDDSSNFQVEAGAAAATAIARSNISMVDILDWFHSDGAELNLWCLEFANLACRDHISLARQAMRVNVLWKQPSLLRLHESFDQIFQVLYSPL
jgi:hypothetical protein